VEDRRDNKITMKILNFNGLSRWGLYSSTISQVRNFCSLRVGHFAGTFASRCRNLSHAPY